MGIEWPLLARGPQGGRPERSLADLAGVLAEDARWSNTPEPGLYARVQVFAPYRDVIREMAPHIGVSHYVSGESKPGNAEGRQGNIITMIAHVRSVDFVTVAGRGGAILESARAEVVEHLARANLEQNTMAALFREFRDLGLSEQEAAAAALGRDHPAKTLQEAAYVADLDETGQQMYREFRSLGFSEGQARGAAIGRGPQAQVLQETGYTEGMDESEKEIYLGLRGLGLSEREARAGARGRRRLL
jgi:hypothetical protein